MIRVDNPIPEPEGFDTDCRKAGVKWLAENPDAERPKDYWSPFRLKLAAGFKGRCGYGAMFVSEGTVDHFTSCDEDRNKAYEWSNYRFISGWINSSKRNEPAEKLLDPFDVQDGWFEIDLPSLQLIMTPNVPPDFLERAKHTLKRLPISHDERIIRVRREWLDMYEEGTPLHILEKRAPLIVKAIRKHNWPRANGELPEAE